MVNKVTIFASMGLLVLVISVSFIWWGFRWTTTDNPAIGIIRGYRWFGRTTLITCDSNRDGLVDSEWAFTWSQPYQGEQFGGITPYKMMREDRNFDGRWDTWIEPVDETMKFTRISADTTGDGKADWIRTCGAFESTEWFEKLKAIRGF